ncbi:MAG: transposase, partial [Verrucomicrobiota bacterium]
MSDTVTSVEKHGTHSVVDQDDFGKLLLHGGCDRYEVEWDAEAKVTPMGSLVFFAQYLQAGGLMDRLCEGTPLAYNSNNAPKERDVLGTIVLSILNGQIRYAHINALRGDRVGAEVLGISKLVSEDSVRRALKRGTAEEWDAWLTVQERAVYEPLLTEPYVLDIDNTVKPLYGHQEGAELGYNPKKPGRPSHNYHTYFIGSLRMVLGVEVMPGKQHAGKHSLPGLWRIIDSLRPECRPRMIRGDVSYGNEDSMVEAEKRNQRYLFKLRQTTKVKKQIRELECDADAWCDAGDGWQGAQRELKLMGWTRSRRCIF